MRKPSEIAAVAVVVALSVGGPAGINQAAAQAQRVLVPFAAGRDVVSLTEAHRHLYSATAVEKLAAALGDGEIAAFNQRNAVIEFDGRAVEASVLLATPELCAIAEVRPCVGSGLSRAVIGPRLLAIFESLQPANGEMIRIDGVSVEVAGQLQPGLGPIFGADVWVTLPSPLLNPAFQVLTLVAVRRNEEPLATLVDRVSRAAPPQQWLAQPLWIELLDRPAVQSQVALQGLSAAVSATSIAAVLLLLMLLVNRQRDDLLLMRSLGAPADVFWLASVSRPLLGILVGAAFVPIMSNATRFAAMTLLRIEGQPPWSADKLPFFAAGHLASFGVAAAVFSTIATIYAARCRQYKLTARGLAVVDAASACVCATLLMLALPSAGRGLGESSSELRFETRGLVYRSVTVIDVPDRPESRELSERLLTMPEAGVASALPLARPLSFTGVSAAGGGAKARVAIKGASKTYFDLLGISVLRGEIRGAENGVVISARAAAALSAHGLADGDLILWGGHPFVVEAVVEDVLDDATRAAYVPTIYLMRPELLLPSFVIVYPRSQSSGLFRTLGTNPSVLLGPESSLSEFVRKARAPSRTSVGLFGMAALFAVWLCVVLSYLVVLSAADLMKREIAIRIALGARPWQLSLRYYASLLCRASAGVVFAALIAGWATRGLIDWGGWLHDTVIATFVVLLSVTLGFVCGSIRIAQVVSRPASALRHA